MKTRAADPKIRKALREAQRALTIADKALARAKRLEIDVSLARGQVAALVVALTQETP